MFFIIWKAIIQDFDLAGKGIAWCIGKGTKFQLGSDSWLRSGANHLLPPDLIHSLKSRAYIF